VLLKARGLDLSLADTAIAITGIDHPFFEILSPTWPRSNPRGYLKWFYSRMAVIFEQRKRELMRKSLRAGTEPIPDYEVSDTGSCGDLNIYICQAETDDEQ
jgi:hypothetical protein